MNSCYNIAFILIWEYNQTQTSLAYNFPHICIILFCFFGSERKYLNTFKSGLFWPKVKNAPSYPKFCAQNDVTLDGVVGRFWDSRSLFDPEEVLVLLWPSWESRIALAVWLEMEPWLFRSCIRVKTEIFWFLFLCCLQKFVPCILVDGEHYLWWKA